MLQRPAGTRSAASPPERIWARRRFICAGAG